MATIVYLAHGVSKDAELRARIVVAEFAEKFARGPSVECRIARDYYTHVDGDDAELCSTLLAIVSKALDSQR